MNQIKETTPTLTPTKKEEANKYIKYIYEATGIKFTCRRLKDYIFIKILYLLMTDYEDITKDFIKQMEDHYIDPKYKKKVEEYSYWGYNLHDIFNAYIYKYVYGDLTNFAVSYEYYLDLVEGRIDREFYKAAKKSEKEIERSYKIIEKKLLKYTEKITHLYDNVGVEMIDVNTFSTFEDLDDAILMWKSQRDERVCETCATLNGRKFRHVEDVPARHPNCRCEILVFREGELYRRF